MSFISFLPALVLSDGLPFHPYFFTLPDISQENQIALIDWKNGEYVLSLFITTDLSSYPENSFLWVVPFQEVPTEIKVEEIAWEDFKREIESLNERIERAQEMNKSHPELKLYFYGGLSSFYVPVLPSLFNLFAFRSFVRAAPVEEAPIIMPEAVFEFGKLGRAEVYDIKNVDLETFFKSKGYPLPVYLSQYRNKKIVVFNLTKLSSKLSVEVKFKFKGSTIFYPSGTTQFWNGRPKEFDIYVKLPSNYKLNSNIEPNFHVKDWESHYYIFSSNELVGEVRRRSLEEIYIEYGTIFPRREELYNKDIEANVVFDRPASLIFLMFPIFGKFSSIFLSILATFISWFVVLFGYFNLLKKKKVKIVRIIRSCVAIPTILFFMNNGLLLGGLLLIFFVESSLLFNILVFIQVVIFFVVLLSLVGIKRLSPIKRLIVSFVPLEISPIEAFCLMIGAIVASILFGFLV